MGSGRRLVRRSLRDERLDAVSRGLPGTSFPLGVPDHGHLRRVRRRDPVHLASGRPDIGSVWPQTRRAPHDGAVGVGLDRAHLRTKQFRSVAARPSAPGCGQWGRPRRRCGMVAGAPGPWTAAASGGDHDGGDIRRFRSRPAHFGGLRSVATGAARPPIPAALRNHRGRGPRRPQGSRDTPSRGSPAAASRPRRPGVGPPYVPDGHRPGIHLGLRFSLCRVCPVPRPGRRIGRRWQGRDRGQARAC